MIQCMGRILGKRRETKELMCRKYKIDVVPNAGFRKEESINQSLDLYCTIHQLCSYAWHQIKHFLDIACHFASHFLTP